LVSDEAGDEGSLSDQLTCIELRDDTLEDFVDDGGEDSFIVVLSEGSINCRQFIDTGTREHTASYIDHLQVYERALERRLEAVSTLCAGEGGDVSRFCSDVVDDGSFKPRDVEMCPFAVDIPANPTDSLILDCSMTALNCPRQ
jgi:hypothetical protein